MGSILFILFVDQGVKLLFLDYFPQRIRVNSGWGFGVFPGYNFYWALLAILVFAITLIYWIHHLQERKLDWLGWFLGAILSNLIDRISYGGVIDIQVNPYLPAVNFADLVLTVLFLSLICGKIGLFYDEKD